MAEKAKYWTCVCYPENMIETWKDDIGNILQNPYAYCVHDGDQDGNEDQRKEHVHIILAFPNTTTYKTALGLFQKLSAPGRICCNTCEQIRNIRFVYNYLIHDTEDCRKKGKHLYKASERITGNNFDIGSFEQLSTEDKRKMADEIEDFIYEHNIYNYADLNYYVKNNFDSQYREVIKSYSGHFDRLCKGMYLRIFSQKKV